MWKEYKELLKNSRQHLMTGVSYMIPVVVSGGLCLAVSYIIGGPELANPFSQTLNKIGNVGIGLYVPIMAAFISYGIAGRMGIAPAIIGGMIANEMGTGFLGAIAVGFLTGYLAYTFNKKIIPLLPKAVRPMSVLSYVPFLITASMGLLVLYVFGPVLGNLAQILKNWVLEFSEGASAIAMGALLGVMEGTDYGGPVSVAAFYSALALMPEGVTTPLGICVSVTLIPSVGTGLAALIAPRFFSKAEKDAGKAALAMGLSGGLIEGAIPFALVDPLSIIPATMIGCGVAGAIAGWGGQSTTSFPAGVFTPLIVEKPLLWIVSAVVGILITTGLIILFKTIRKVRPSETEEE